MSKVHEYFKSASEEWNIQDFLEQYDVEPFDQKIDCYIKSLEAIVNHGVGKRKKAQFLLNSMCDFLAHSVLDTGLVRAWGLSRAIKTIVKLLEVGTMKDLTTRSKESNEKDNSNKIFNEEDEAGDNIDLDYVSKLKLFTSQSTGSTNYADKTIGPKLANFTKKRNKSFEETEEQKEPKCTYVLEWDLYENMKQIVMEWTIDDTSISDAFFSFKNFAESQAARHELKFKDNPGEILEALEEEIDNAHNDLRTNLSPSDKKSLRTSQNIWNHIAENWQTSFDSPQTIEDTHVHHAMHPFLCPFSPNGPDRMIDWKTNDNDEGHKPDFMITVNKRSGKFEVVFGLFKLPYKSSSHFMNVDLVDLGVLMKDSTKEVIFGDIIVIRNTEDTDWEFAIY
nr:3942_t:CDS:10 [Entrophospora candida]